MGNVKTANKLKDGCLLVETLNAQQTNKLLSCKDFGGQCSVEITPHNTLNYRKGVIHHDHNNMIFNVWILTK